MKIRIVDIAKKAGVSVGTVDRIIHQRGRYSEKANEKVQQAIKELGYAPDLMARNLALKKELRIVCLLPSPQDIIYWERPYIGIEQAEKELASFKVKVEKVSFIPRVDEFKSACQKVLDMQPDGVVYVPMFMKESEEFSRQLHQHEIPFIHINIHHKETSPASFVGQDPIAAGEVAASLCHLALRNQQSVLITYISTEKQEYSHHQDRIDGFLQFFKQQNNTPTINHLHLKINSGLKNYEEQLIQHLKAHPETHIIYVPNSRAYRIASILKKHQIHNKMIIGFDTLKENVDLLMEGYIDILIGQQSKNQGYHAVIYLFNALFRKEAIDNTYYLPIDILNRQNIKFYEGGLE